jgi:hypothetical protein
MHASSARTAGITGAKMFDDDPYPPLITPRSPSYERASREFLNPTTTGDPQVIAILARLCEAEHNASEVCMGVARIVASEALATQMRERAGTHHDRKQALGELIVNLGGSAPTPEECRQILVQAIDALDRASDDAAAKQVLRVMRAELRSEYDAAIASPEVSEHRRESLSQLAPEVAPSL